MVIILTFEYSKNISFENVEENFMKIFKKTNYRNTEEDIQDIPINSDDSDMKIFLKE